MSSTSALSEQSKKRERTSSEYDYPDSSKQAKQADYQTPTSHAQNYAAYPNYPQNPHVNYSYPPNYQYPQYAASAPNYQYPPQYYTQPVAKATAPISKTSHTAYSTYTPTDGSDAPSAYTQEHDPLALPTPASEVQVPEEKKHLRYAAGHVWEDKSMSEWPENDFRIYVGNLGKEVDDKTLYEAFKKYPTLAHWKVIRDKRDDTPKGFGFVSFLDPREGVKALKEMNNKYIGQRPCKLTKSTHDKRSYDSSKKKR